MGIFDKFFGKKEEKKFGFIAEERLKLILARNKKGDCSFDIEAMEKEIIEVVKKYVKKETIEISTESDNNVEALAIEVKY